MGNHNSLVMVIKVRFNAPVVLPCLDFKVCFGLVACCLLAGGVVFIRLLVMVVVDGLFLGGCFFVGRCHAFVGGAAVEGGSAVCCCWWRFVVGGGLFVSVKWSGGSMLMTRYVEQRGDPTNPNRAPQFAPKLGNTLFTQGFLYILECGPKFGRQHVFVHFRLRLWLQFKLRLSVCGSLFVACLGGSMLLRAQSCLGGGTSWWWSCIGIGTL